MSGHMKIEHVMLLDMSLDSFLSYSRVGICKLFALIRSFAWLDKMCWVDGSRKWDFSVSVDFWVFADIVVGTADFALDAAQPLPLRVVSSYPSWVWEAPVC